MSSAARKQDHDDDSQESKPEGTAADPITHAVLSRALVRVAQLVIGRVIRNSENAVVAVTEKLGKFADLDDRQRDLLASATSSYMKSTVNSAETSTTSQGETSASGEMVRTNEFLLRKTLNEISGASEKISDRIMPVITSLQFQDRLRQELEALSASFDDYFDCVKSLGQVSAAIEPPEEFWRKAVKNFHSTEVREAVLRCAMGDDYEINEEDIRVAQATGGDGFFF